MRVTFDTNLCNLLHKPDKWPKLAAAADILVLLDGLREGRIQGSFAEASLAVECLEFTDKLRALVVSGTDGDRPAPQAAAQQRYEALTALGLRQLRARLTGGETFFQATQFAVDINYDAETRRARFGEFVRGRPGLTALRQFGNELLAEQMPLPPAKRKLTDATPMARSELWELRQDWAVAIHREWERLSEVGGSGKGGFRKKVSGLLREWSDVLVVGAHYAYGNDVLCTTDSAKSSGPGSILHVANRDALQALGVTVMSPGDLAGQVRS